MNSFEKPREASVDTPKNVFEERERYVSEVAVWAKEFTDGLGPQYRVEVSVSLDKRDADGDYVVAKIFSGDTNEPISVTTLPFGEPEEPADPHEREALVKMYLKHHFETAMAQR